MGNEELFGESVKIFPLYKLLEFRKGTIVLVEACAYVCSTIHEFLTENKVPISILLRSSINCLEHLLNPMVYLISFQESCFFFFLLDIHRIWISWICFL